MDDAPLNTVRSLGFDNTFKGSAEAETLFFVGPLGERSPTATDDALAEFLQYLQHALETVELYLANGKNPNTHEWTEAGSEARPISLNAAVTLAIFKAEHASAEASRLWEEVAVCEAALYAELPKGSLESDIAKRGIASAMATAERTETEWSDMQAQLGRWETLVREMRDARAHNLPKSFSEALDALVDELPKAVPDKQRAMAIKEVLDQIPLTEARRKMAEAGGDYIRNKMGLPPVNAADAQQDSDQNRLLADELGLSSWVHDGNIYIQDGGKHGRTQSGWEQESSSTSSRPATDQEVAMWGQLKRWRDGMAAVAAGSK